MSQILLFYLLFIEYSRDLLILNINRSSFIFYEFNEDYEDLLMLNIKKSSLYSTNIFYEYSEDNKDLLMLILIDLHYIQGI